MIRQAVARIAANTVADFRAALGITSPSLAFLDAARLAKRRPYVAPAPPPWYAARGARDRWETPELAAAARRVRRLIRRHWWALAFDYDGNMAMAVRRAMTTPPKQPDSPSLFEAVQQLNTSGVVPRVDPEMMWEIYERAGVRRTP